MKLAEIKKAVDEGKVVHWSNSGYEVRVTKGDYYIYCPSNKHMIGLTWLDGVTMNGEEKDFYLAEPVIKRTHILLGKEAVSNYDDGGIDELVSAIEDDGISFDVYTWEGDSKQVLDLLCTNFGDSYSVISESDFDKLMEI